MKETENRAISIFYSYAYEDKEFQEKLEKHLLVFKRNGLISTWNSQEIHAGHERESEINEQLNSADIVLLLISPDFIASDYCYSNEMQRAIERHQQEKARVIPIILRPVHWEDTPIGKFKVLPSEAKPIVSWKNQDEAYYDIVAGIIETMSPSSSSNNSQPNKSEEKTPIYPHKPIHYFKTRNTDGFELIIHFKVKEKDYFLRHIYTALTKQKTLFLNEINIYDSKAVSFQAVGNFGVKVGMYALWGPFMDKYRPVFKENIFIEGASCEFCLYDKDDEYKIVIKVPDKEILILEGRYSYSDNRV